MVLMRDLQKKILVFLEMIKFEHSLFALPFAYLGLFLAEEGWPRWGVFFWVTVAMVSFRTMAMALNRLIDVSIDSKNPRTQNRALVTGGLKKSFVGLFAFLSLLVFEFSASKLRPICLILSPIPVCLACFYPWLKRFTWMSHLILGMILAIAPYGAWLASRGEFSWVPAFLSFGIVTWVAGFDVIYAFQDFDHDRLEGLFSIPARFGIAVSLRITAAFHLLSIVFWSVTGYLAGLGWIFGAGLVFAAGILFREDWLIRRYGQAKLQEVFFRLNAMLSLVLFLAAVGDLVY
ncbi:MAG: UbiA family prenyltransferase [Candidatus Omnitrophica bacterium]|nr:UbiA family prenyltransferase [Candidatus Omnitrophota bacterium]